MVSKEFIASRISQLRASKDVSARDMSLSLGYNENYINRIENEKASPSMEVFFYICEYFGLTAKEFFNDEVNYPLEYRDLMTDLLDLDRKEIESIHGIVKSLKQAKSK